jgi:hypothetical protein
VDFDTKPVDLVRLLGKIEASLRKTAKGPAQNENASAAAMVSSLASGQVGGC